MRPLNEREIMSGQQKAFSCINANNAVAQMRDGAPVEGQIYYYDKVFDENATTVDVYSYIGRNLVQGVMNGINGTIFACKFLQVYDSFVALNLSILVVDRWTNIFG